MTCYTSVAYLQVELHEHYPNEIRILSDVPHFICRTSQLLLPERDILCVFRASSLPLMQPPEASRDATREWDLLLR